MITNNNHQTDLVIISSTYEEFRTVIRILEKDSSTPLREVSGGLEATYRTKSRDGENGVYRLFIMRLHIDNFSNMLATNELISQRKPRYILLLGGVTGVPGKKIRLGDILIPDQILTYESIKSKSINSATGEIYRPDALIINAVKKTGKGVWSSETRKILGKSNICIGEIAGFSKLMDSNTKVQSIIKNLPNLLGFETENISGVISAIRETRGDQPKLLIIRIVTDLLDQIDRSQSTIEDNVEKLVRYFFEFLKAGFIPVNKQRDYTQIAGNQVDLFDNSTENEETIQSSDNPGFKNKASKENDIGQNNRSEVNEIEREFIPFQIPSYDSDQNGEEDYLDIEQDVEAFASLICARSTLPPLSIGLFGEWGSGKSFFMRKLRNQVDEISLEARNADKLQKEIAYYKRVVQIEFNAWHYAEGNLWASLVEHILANLRIQGEKQDIIESLQKKLLLELAEHKIDESQAEKNAEDAKKELTTLEETITNKKEEYKKVSENLYDLKAKDILKTIVESDDVQRSVDKLKGKFQDLGISDLGNSGKDFLGALDEMRQTIQRGNTILVPFVNSPYRWKWILLFVSFILIAPIIGLVVGWALQQTSNQWLSQYSAWVTTITLWIGIVSGTIRRAAKWVSDRITPIEQLKKRIDDKVTSQQNKINEEIAELEKEKLELAQEKEVAVQRLEDAKRNVELTEEKLKQATPARLRAKFIQDRVESNDYKKHLGVLALVRSDFEKLSNFIEHENNECEKFETLDQELADADSRINRIVLYIDDLDRCSAEKVVQVLEAVHLLLAFPLFVVVVAVDARWVSGALYGKYQNLLKPKNTVTKDSGKDNELIGATALDYLEKIFQIPFWLSPMNVAARKAMIEGLVKVNLVEATTQSTLNNKANLGFSFPFSGTVEFVQPLADLEQSKAELTPETIEQDLNPTALTITPEEQLFINQLAPLLGRSPRALKRFINVYRLIKTSVPEEVQSRFLSKRNGEFRIAMFLLAIVTHAPEFSQDFFGALYKFRQENPKASKLKVTDWDHLFGSGISSLNNEEYQLINWLQSKDAQPIRNANLRRIIWWAQRASRFSFLLEPAVAEWLTIDTL